MFDPRPADRMWPSQSFVRSSLDFRESKSILYILTTFPYFKNLEFDIFDAVGLQCHFITFATITVRILALPVHQLS